MPLGDCRLPTAGPAAILRPMKRNFKLRKREIALAIGVGTLATFAATGILSDGFGGPGSSFENVSGLEAAPPSPAPRN